MLRRRPFDLCVPVAPAAPILCAHRASRGTNSAARSSQSLPAGPSWAVGEGRARRVASPFRPAVLPTCLPRPDSQSRFLRTSRPNGAGDSRVLPGGEIKRPSKGRGRTRLNLRSAPRLLAKRPRNCQFIRQFALIYVDLGESPGAIRRRRQGRLGGTSEIGDEIRANRIGIGVRNREVHRHPIHQALVTLAEGCG